MEKHFRAHKRFLSVLGDHRVSFRFGRVRPAKNQPRVPSRIRYGVTLRIEEYPEKLKGPRMEAGCFVLISNIPKTHEKIGPAKGIPRLYKKQIGIEKDFGFLKDQAIVNAIFLKNPARIEAFGAPPGDRPGDLAADRADPSPLCERDGPNPSGIGRETDRAPDLIH